MTLVRSQAALDACRKHINSLPRADPQIEAVLAAYACSVIYAELEAQVVESVVNRASRGTSDPRVLSWAKVAARRIVRSIRIAELAGIAGHFHNDCKADFHANLTDQDKAAWDQIITNRHGVAHQDSTAGQISTMTFKEVEEAFARVAAVMSCFEASLG